MIESLGYIDKRIFDAELSDDKKYLILTEACDKYFTVDLTKDQVLELVNDFKVIADQMAN